MGWGGGGCVGWGSRVALHGVVASDAAIPPIFRPSYPRRSVVCPGGASTLAMALTPASTTAVTASSLLAACLVRGSSRYLLCRN